MIINDDNYDFNYFFYFFNQRTLQYLLIMNPGYSSIFKIYLVCCKGVLIHKNDEELLMHNYRSIPLPQDILPENLSY